MIILRVTAAVASWLLIVATLFTGNLRARGDFPGFPFMCVQGYGAYLMLMMLKSTDSMFKCACAMSPVTDWKLYGESCGMLALHFHHTAACTWIRVSVRFGPVEFVPVCNCTRPTDAATGWRGRGSPWDDTCAVFLCWGLVSWALSMFTCLHVLRLHLLSSTQRRRSLSDTSACLYGMTADTRCVYFLPPLDLWTLFTVARDTPAAQLLH